MKILVVDDHPVVLSGCRSLFASDKRFILEEAQDEKSGYKAFRTKKPDVTILDINLPDLSGFELLRKILKADPAARVIMFSMADDPSFVVRAIEMGAKGYVSKGDDPKCLVQAVKKVATGGNFVSPHLAQSVTFAAADIQSDPQARMTQRELEILRGLSRGARISEIANSLDISYKTVANTTSILKKKLGAKSHSDLIRLAVNAELT